MSVVYRNEFFDLIEIEIAMRPTSGPKIKWAGYFDPCSLKGTLTKIKQMRTLRSKMTREHPQQNSRRAV